MREREAGDGGGSSMTDEEGRGLKEMEAEGARRCDGKKNSAACAQEIFCPKKVVRKRRRGKNRW